MQEQPNQIKLVVKVKKKYYQSIWIMKEQLFQFQQIEYIYYFYNNISILQIYVSEFQIIFCSFVY
jgi:hypothetical protein